MFTGLIEALGKVEQIQRGESAIRLGITTPFESFTGGESIAVEGVCLTVADHRGSRFDADVIPETLSCTTLGSLRPGSPVNLERSLRLQDRLGGHLVQGHVDAVAPVLERIQNADEYRLRFGWTPEIRRFIAFKGSVALSGVSMTVAAVDREGFEVALIPETLERTTLSRLRGGDAANVEVDLLARYLDRLTSRESELETNR